jgi:hypothetical protein
MYDRCGALGGYMSEWLSRFGCLGGWRFPITWDDVCHREEAIMIGRCSMFRFEKCKKTVVVVVFVVKGTREIFYERDR